MSNPLVAEKQDSTTSISGITFLEGGKAIKDGIESGDWASIAMGAVGVGMDALAFVADPFGSILAAGVGWLMEHVGPLKEALDKLAGDPDQITAHSQTWKNIATEVSEVATDLANQIKTDLHSWTGPGADAYRAQAGEVAKTLEGTAQACDGAASGVKTAGEIVAAVRMLVRDIIAQVVAHMISWALQVLLTLGVGMAWVVPQVVNLVAKTAKQIAELIKNLAKALKALGQLLGKAGKLFGDAGKALKGLKPGAKPNTGKIDTLPSGAKSVDSGGGRTTASGAGKENAPPPKNTGETTASGAGKDGDSAGGSGGASHGGGTPKDVPKDSPRDTTAPSHKPGDPRTTAVGKDGRVCKSDPVDIANGHVILAETDLELPSPLVLERLHVSSYRAGHWFGASWTSTVDQRLEVDDEHVCYFSPDGMILVYPRPGRGETMLPLEGARRPLRLEDGVYVLSDPIRGGELRFASLPGHPRNVVPLVEFGDREGNRVDVEYDSAGVPRAFRHSAGYRAELDTEDGRVTALRVVDPGTGEEVLVRRFGYDERRRLTQVVNSSGLAERFDYDIEGRLTGWQDRNGTWYRYVYDADGRCVRTVGDRGFYDGEFAYDREQRITRYVDSLGHATEFHLNDAGQPVREVGPLGATTLSTWDRYDRLLSRTDPLGRTTGFEYDEDGALVAVRRPDGVRAGVRFAEDGALTVTVVAEGRTWRRTYPAGEVPDLFTAQAANPTRFDQDRQWGAGPAKPPAGDPAERDLFGRPRVVTDALGASTRLGWTVEGLRAGRTGPSGRQEAWRYDGEGNVVEHAGVRYEYGPFDLPVAKIDATGARTTYEYDTELRLVRVTNPAGLTWSYVYDAAGKLSQETDFDGRVLRFSYDAAGQLVQAVDGLGGITTYTYDALGNVVERRTATGTTTYAYDPTGLLVRATEADCVLEIERDEAGRVVRESVDGQAVTYAYDGNAMRRRTPSGVDSRWSFDEQGLPVALDVDGHVVSFRHDPAGREIGRRIGAGAELTQTFDAEHQLTGQTVTSDGRVVQRRRYGYRIDGALVEVDDAISGTVRFRTDAAGRVVGVAGPGGEEVYQYDASGNIVRALGAAPEPGPRGYTGNRVTAAGSVRYAHDGQGRRVARHEPGRSWFYHWDALDRLVGVRTPDGVEWRYRYDPLGRRIAKQRLAPGPDAPVVAEETRFAWSGQLLVEEVRRGTDGQPLVLTWDHRPGTAQPITQTERLGSGVRFFSFLTDQIGTPVDMIDARGVVAWHGTASLWGRSRPGPARTVSTPLRFPGQYTDDETGLHYNVFRYYDPGTGHYLSQDPLGLVPAPNPAAYVPNPLRESDPLGLGCTNSKPQREDGHELTPNRPAGGHDASHTQGANSSANPHGQGSHPPPGNRPPQHASLAEGQVDEVGPGGTINYPSVTSCVTITAHLEGGGKVGGHASIMQHQPRPDEPWTGLHSDEILGAMKNKIDGRRVENVQVIGATEFFNPAYLKHAQERPGGSDLPQSSIAMDEAAFRRMMSDEFGVPPNKVGIEDSSFGDVGPV